MSVGGSIEWRKLPVSLSELCINTTLRCGQSFRWRKSGTDEWSCALHGRILTLKQDSSHLHYRAIFPARDGQPASKKRKLGLPTPPSSVSSTPTHSNHVDHVDDTHRVVHNYLNLSPNLTQLYAQWSQKDQNFKRRVLSDMQNLQGIRILRQNPWEALCGFICSSNNNIKRISLMMNRLCARYGQYIGDLEEEVLEVKSEDVENLPPSPGASDDGHLRRRQTVKVPYYDFPPPSALTGPDVESTLRELGFGYRAKYIYQTACVVANEKGGVAWLDSLVNPEIKDIQRSQSLESGSVDIDGGVPAKGRDGYLDAHAALLELTGVGPKVADCVCLMGLGWGEAVPVDTHVWQIAVRDYKFSKGKMVSMTKALYDSVGERFRALWGKEAGWAHSVLFTADLRDFKERVVKVEVKEEDVELALSDVEKPQVVGRKRRVVVEKMVKQPFDDVETKVVEVQQEVSRPRKRARRGA